MTTSLHSKSNSSANTLTREQIKLAEIRDTPIGIHICLYLINACFIDRVVDAVLERGVNVLGAVDPHVLNRNHASYDDKAIHELGIKVIVLYILVCIGKALLGSCSNVGHVNDVDTLDLCLEVGGGVRYHVLHMCKQVHFVLCYRRFED